MAINRQLFYTDYWNIILVFKEIIKISEIFIISLKIAIK